MRHNVTMAGNHQFKIKVEEDPQTERRYRWSIYEGDELRDRSSQSYATIPHAKADAERVMQRRKLAKRQMTKHPQTPAIQLSQASR
jgi:hypothetical protein